MYTRVKLYSNQNGEITRFLNQYYHSHLELDNDLEWEKEFPNPIEMAEIIGTFIENNDKYQINMWVSLDEGMFIHVTDDNVDDMIRYLYERFPY